MRRGTRKTQGGFEVGPLATPCQCKLQVAMPEHVDLTARIVGRLTLPVASSRYCWPNTSNQTEPRPAGQSVTTRGFTRNTRAQLADREKQIRPTHWNALAVLPLDPLE